MKVAVYGRLLKARDVGHVQQLFDLLPKHNFEVVVEENYYSHLVNRIETHGAGTFTGETGLNGDVDYLICMGGDGTLLDTIALVRSSRIPVLGINIGRLGFLATIGVDQMEQAVQALVNKTYSLDERTLIHLDSNRTLFPGANFALNEFTIHKKDTSSMITIHTYINGEILNSYWADGLIVSTPTGSTGYSLSCGGPIIFPTSENFVITPVAPHNLNVRPIIVSQNSVISFEVEGRAENFQCTLDSRYETIDSSTQLAVRKEDFSVRLIRLDEVNFMNTLREKLAWGKDKRN